MGCHHLLRIEAQHDAKQNIAERHIQKTLKEKKKKKKKHMAQGNNTHPRSEKIKQTFHLFQRNCKNIGLMGSYKEKKKAKQKTPQNSKLLNSETENTSKRTGGQDTTLQKFCSCSELLTR